jgi:hypothetical protein
MIKSRSSYAPSELVYWEEFETPDVAIMREM